MALKVLAALSCFLAVSNSIDPTKTPNRLHAALFFSDKPALKDSLGVAYDSKSASLSCVGGSRDGTRVNFEWFKEGSSSWKPGRAPVTATLSGDLQMNPSDYTRDDGFYRCLITDQTWSLLSNRAELRLAYISGTPPRDQTVTGTQNQGWSYIYKDYSHSKYPKPKFIWKFKGRRLVENDRISISEDGNLYIAKLTLDDAGKYSCEMQLGTLRQTRESINLQVTPSSSTSDVYATAMLGPKSKRVSLQREKETTFECFATGKPMPKLKWKKDGRELKDGRKYVMSSYNKRLTIKDLNKADSGKYSCEFTRAELGTNFPVATLTVIEPPVIKGLEPVNQVRHIGSYTTLTCMVTGEFKKVSFSVSWYRNGVKLSKSSRILMSYKTYWNYRNYTLNVTKLNKDDDSGMYQCFARNDGGEAMAYTDVNVLKMRPYIYCGPGVVYAALGRPARIVCRARGSPPITYTWKKNGLPITSLTPADNGKNGTYIIKSVRSSDVAQYTCIASNGKTLGDTYESTGHLELATPTVVVNQSAKVYAAKGSQPYLHCGVRYDKKVNVTYKWYFKGNLLDRHSSRYIYRSVGPVGRLEIVGVYERDNGIYRCDSSSSVGKFSTDIELIVQAPPLVTTVPRVKDIRPDSVLLQWIPGYHGNSAIKYFRIGVKIPINNTEVILPQQVTSSGPSGLKQRHDVPGLVPYTYYHFRVQAVNSVGSSPWSGYSKKIRTIESAPSYKLKKPTEVSVDDNTIDVEWEDPPKSTHNGILLGYHVAWRYAGLAGTFTTKTVTPATNRKLKIDGLILNSPYEIKVRMFNNAGAGPYSDVLDAKTKEGVPSSPPRNLAVRNASARSVVLQWDDPPQLDWNGELTQYTIHLWEYDEKDKSELRIAKRDPSTFTQVFNVTKLKTYTQYTFEVNAQNSVGASNYSNQVQIRTTEDIPTAPRQLQIVDEFSDTISVKWLRPREVNGVLVGYVVKYWIVNNYDQRIGQIKTEQIKGDALQTGVTDLASRTSYMIEIAAKTKAGVSRSSRIKGRTQDVAQKPRAPTDLRFFETNATAIELTWTEGWKGNSPIIKYIIQGNNETGFANDRSSKWFDALIVIDPYKMHNLPPVIIQYLQPDTVYRFRVKAVNKAGSSPYSSISGDITTSLARPYSPPVNIKVKNTQYLGEVFLTWDHPPRKTWNSPNIKYVIELQQEGESGNFSKIIHAGIPGNIRRYRLSALSKYTSYEIKIKTVNTAGDSPYSPVIKWRTQEYVPSGPPENIRANSSSASSIQMSWDEVLQADRNGIITGYKLFYRLVLYEPQDFIEIDVRDVKEYTLKDLLGYTRYDIRILAYTKTGDGKLSHRLYPYPRTLETRPGPPSKLRFPTITPSVVVVTWAPPEMTGGNITRYRVSYRLRDDSSARTVVRPTLSSSKLTDSITSLSPDKFYIFEVQAYTAVGWGEEASAEIYTSRNQNTEKPERPIILPIPDSDITWRSIKVRWAVARRRNDPIRYFTLKLRKGQGAWETHPKPLSGDDEELVVWGLEPNHVYIFEITATNDAGTSPPSKPSIPVRTLAKSDPGSPRDVTISSPTAKSFFITWKPPSLVDIETKVKQYILGHRLHEPNPSSNEHYLDARLSASDRSYQITGLDEYTLYDIRIKAVDANGDYLPSYRETRRTSAERPRRPSLRENADVGPTSVTIFWGSPGRTKTPLLGYKAVYKINSRRRRAVREYCETPEPGAVYFSNTSTSGRITGLHMYTSYEIVLRSFNTAGDSDSSNSISVRTSEGVPGPPAVFSYDGVYDVEIHVYWEAPCEPNGKIKDYILTVTTGRRQVQKKKLDEDKLEYEVVGLARLTAYTLKLVARTSRGEGIPKVLEVRTAGPAVKPWPPKILSATSENNEVTLTWKVTFHGNSPITKYRIEFRKSSEKAEWRQGMDLGPLQINKNRTDRTIWAVLKDLDPNTVYWMRMKIQNKVDWSDLSDSSQSVTTGPAVPKTPKDPIYEEIWFIAVMAVIGFLIIFLFICICLLCCRKRRRSKDLRYPVEYEMDQNSRLRPYSSYEETLSNGGSKTYRDEKPLVEDVESEPEEEDREEEEEEASSLSTKSNLSDSDESSDDIATKKRKMEAALRDEEKYRPGIRSHSTDQLHNSPPPAYATFASRGKGRSQPSLDPYADYDDDFGGKPYQLPYRPPTRRSAFEPYDGESSESSDLANRRRNDPRSSSFRRALFTGGPSQPEPERPYEPSSRPQPRKYRSLEKAVNENGKPPSYHDDDDDDDDDGSGQRSLPPEYRSDSGRDSSDDREPLTQRSGRHRPQDRAESPAPEYDSDDSTEKQRLTNGRPAPQPEISSYSSFV